MPKTRSLSALCLITISIYSSADTVCIGMCGSIAFREVCVQRSLFRTDAASGIVHKETVEEIQAVVVESVDEGFVVVANPLREGCLEVREGSYTRPVLFGWRAENTVLLLAGMLRVGDEVSYRKILKISSISESPGKRGLRVHISAKMQPTDHMSTPVEYCRPPSRISGDRYHSVTTCL